MTIRSLSFQDGDVLPARHAFCVPGSETPSALGLNVSPHLAWEGAPDGTLSYAVLAVDVDVPANPKGANEEGKTIPYDAERADFYHWVLVNIPLDVTELAEGADSDAVAMGGKATGLLPYGQRGANSYTQFFKGDKQMGGTYGGYDGPCPPWNDERTHRYRFTVYALSTGHLDLYGSFSGPDAVDALRGHVLDEATITGLYALSDVARIPQPVSIYG